MLSAVLKYYQSKSDTTDQVFEIIAKLENNTVKKSIVSKKSDRLFKIKLNYISTEISFHIVFVLN